MQRLSYFTINGSNRPPRPAHFAAEPPGYYRFSRAPRPTASYVQFSFNGALRLFQSSNKAPTKKRHKMELGDHSASQQGAPLLRDPVESQSSAFEAASSFFQNPRARVSGHLNGGYGFISLGFSIRATTLKNTQWVPVPA